MRSRAVDRIGHCLASRSRDRVAHPPIGGACLTSDQAKTFELAQLPAHRGIVTADPVGEIDHPERAETLNENEQGKKRAVQPDPGFAKDGLIALRPVHHADDVEHRDAVLTAAPQGGFTLATRTVPLFEVEQAWGLNDRRRTVFKIG
jgi:hypothetical protein